MWGSIFYAADEPDHSYFASKIDEESLLTVDLAIFAWIYRAVATLRTGEQDVVDRAGAMFIFRRMAE